MSFIYRKCFTSLGIALVLVACSPSETASSPAEISDSTTCALDGMTLIDYPGPKAQIHYEGDKEPMFFCDTIEMFSLYLKPEQIKKIKALYVQDMSKTQWDAPRGAWMDARNAFYVVGSKKHGSMGPTMGSFSEKSDAEAFVIEHGGKVHPFTGITSNMVSLDGGALHDHPM